MINIFRCIFAMAMFLSVVPVNTPAFEGYNDSGTPDGYYKQIRRSLIDQQNRAEMQANIQAAADLQAAIANVNASISADRAKFWELYPDKPGFEDARKAFYADLLHKDMFYITQGENARTAGKVGANAVDGGIPLGAIFEFNRWGKAIHDDEFPNHDPLGVMANALQISFVNEGAIERTQKYYDAYVVERDWCEFDAAHRNPAGSENIDFYGAMLCQRWEKRTAEDAMRQYTDMKKVLGADALTAALSKVRDAAKNDQGDVADLDSLNLFQPDLDKQSVAGPAGKFPSEADPLSVVVALVSAHDPRLNVIAALAHASPQVQIESEKSKTPYGYITSYQYDWKDGEQTYDEWVAALGADAVQRASTALSASSFAGDGRVLMNRPAGQAGETSVEGFTDAILQGTDEKGHLRATIAQMFKLTTSGAIDDKYNQYVAAYGEQALLAAGEKYWRAENQIYGSIYPADGDVLKAVLENKIKFDAKGNVDTKVGNPEFLSWKSFPVGTKITFASGSWSDQKGIFFPYRSSRRVLTAVNDNNVVVEVVEANYFKERPPSLYHSVDTVSAESEPPLPKKIPLREGDEMVPIGNCKIRCHWDTVAMGKDPTGKDGQRTIWRSDLVPNHVVRTYDCYTISGKPPHFESGIVSIDPVPPSFGAPDSGGPLTPSGLIDFVPPFPNGVPPAEPPPVGPK